MKKAVYALILGALAFGLFGCAKYKSVDVDRAAEQLTIQQNLDSAVKTGVKRGEYDDMVDDAARSLNAFKNSSAASNLPKEIVDGLVKHIDAHQSAKIAWKDDQDNAQKGYDAAYDEYLLDDYSTPAPDIEDYLEIYDTVQDAWELVPDLTPVSDKIAECRKSSK